MVALAVATAFMAAPAFAEDPPAPPPTPEEIAQRLKDVEAYIANTAPSKITQPGPGHNAWMMTSAALVLFMTLPGLALFYGGLVRRKNLLSVMAQCLGCAGLIPILWWLCGYSFIIAKPAESNIFAGILLHGVPPVCDPSELAGMGFPVPSHANGTAVVGVEL